jgi:hypothetical protein
VPQDNAVSDASDGHILITSPSQGKQWVADFGIGYNGRAEVTRTTSAAALWGNIFWVPGTAGKGGVRPYNLTNRTFGSTFQTAATCASSSGLQADDRWLDWSCGSTAGGLRREDQEEHPRTRRYRHAATPRRPRPLAERVRHGLRVLGPTRRHYRRTARRPPAGNVEPSAPPAAGPGDRPPRDEYLLTDAGRALLPVLGALREWGEHCATPCAPRPPDPTSRLSVGEVRNHSSDA